MEKSGVEEIQNGTVFVHIETQQVFEITGNTQHLVRPRGNINMEFEKYLIRGRL
jgi:hypothetical protein